jgi:transglutaminase-like putative cysteine protease
VNSEALRLSDEPVARAMPALISLAYIRNSPQTAPDEIRMEISRTGDASRGVVYTPYYTLPFRWPTEPYNFTFYDSESSLLELARSIPSDSFSSADLTEFNSQVKSRDTYLQIDDYTATNLRRLAQQAGIDQSAHRAVIADRVAEYILSAGRYTLSPYVTPEGENFTLYFLQTAKQGYCIHFATAATLMLRALDVPARFTSGFVITVSRGTGMRTPGSKFITTTLAGCFSR